MERESFVFYRSFYKAIMKLDDKDLAQAIRAICAYALDGELIECEGIAEIIFDMAKPQIDANNNRFVNGQKGGRPKKTIGRSSAGPDHVTEHALFTWLIIH